MPHGTVRASPGASVPGSGLRRRCSGHFLRSPEPAQWDHAGEAFPQLIAGGPHHPCVKRAGAERVGADTTRASSHVQVRA